IAKRTRLPGMVSLYAAGVTTVRPVTGGLSRAGAGKAAQSSPAAPARSSSQPRGCCERRRICGNLHGGSVLFYELRRAPTMSKSLLAVAFLLPFLAAPAVAETKLTRFTYTEPQMGTTFKIILYAPDQAAADKAAKAAFARVVELDGIMSDYKPASELMRLC